ncbi:hypothetical protein LI82_05060 [Methanococcoides methylutens]|uniref:Zona occludens toxin N-terminal domain-containing protein n=1 Tax=Methanococcoides methylutens TaxID=2226 RepID=A0A099T2G7_METMT|nr:hypothetical protein [Methanococcoides methylutens]KGK99375.1 hypothetical protein LI82_05060 [Methanococcoides methylutens]
MSLSDFLHDLCYGYGSYLAFGSIRQGKTGLIMRMVDIIHEENPDRPVYFHKFPRTKMHLLPDWVEIVNNVDDVPKGAVLVKDDSGLNDDVNAKSSRSADAKQWARFLAVMGQRRITLLMTIQNTAIVSLDSFRFGYINMFFKRYDEVSRTFERSEFQAVINPVQKMFDRRVSKGFDSKRLSYVFSPHFHGWIENDLPSWWSQDLSEAFDEVKLNV